MVFTVYFGYSVYFEVKRHHTHQGEEKMPTIIATMMPKRDLPKPLADHVFVAPEIEVMVGTFPEPAKTEAKREEAWEALMRSMDALNDQAKANGLTQEKLDQILQEIDEEEDERLRKAGLPVKDKSIPTSINNW